MAGDSVEIRAAQPLVRELSVPGDKSVSHRALMFAMLADGTSRIQGLQTGLDVQATRRAVEAVGARVRDERGQVIVDGCGIGNLSEPTDIIDCANSGTTMRLMAGILAGQGFLSVLTGDQHLRRRPMARILDPLREMGALALGREEDNKAPLVFRGGTLRALTWPMPVASAQVKSAVLLAGLHARGTTWVEEPAPSRDHTERMLAGMGAEVLSEPGRVGIVGKPKLAPADFVVPGDPSSAAFWAAAALMVPRSRITVRGVSLNPTRTGFFRLLQRMGAPLEMRQTGVACGEPVGDVTVQHGPLRGIEVGAEEVPAAIDEFPVFCVVAAVAEGDSEVRGAEELRHKESDRIDVVAGELRKTGVAVDTFSDGLRVRGGQPLVSTRFQSHGDHRVAMAMGILALAIPQGAVVEGAAAASVSYPDFWRELLRA